MDKHDRFIDPVVTMTRLAQHHLFTLSLAVVGLAPHLALADVPPGVRGLRGQDHGAAVYAARPGWLMSAREMLPPRLFPGDAASGRRIGLRPLHDRSRGEARAGSDEPERVRQDRAAACFWRSLLIGR